MCVLTLLKGQVEVQVFGFCSHSGSLAFGTVCVKPLMEAGLVHVRTC